MITRFIGTKRQWEALRDMDITLQSQHPFNIAMKYTYMDYIMYLLQRMQLPNWRAYLVEKEGEFVGFVSFYDDALGGVIGDAIYIKEEWRRTSVFKEIFEKIIEEARSHKYIKADLLQDMESMVLRYGFHKDCARYYLFSEEVKE